MLIYGGVEIRRLETSLQDPKEGDVYVKLRIKLNNYFSPRKNVHYARYLFLKTKQFAGENTVSYAARLREKALKCDFHDIDERILEHIIQTTTNAELVRQVLDKQWTLQQTFAEMQLMENTSEQAKAMGKHETHDEAKINKRKAKNKNKCHNRSRTRSKTCDANTVIGHIRDKRNFALHTENFATKVASRIIFQQCVCQQRRSRQMYRRVTNH